MGQNVEICCLLTSPNVTPGCIQVWVLSPVSRTNRSRIKERKADLIRSGQRVSRWIPTFTKCIDFVTETALFHLRILLKSDSILHRNWLTPSQFDYWNTLSPGLTQKSIKWLQLVQKCSCHSFSHLSPQIQLLSELIQNHSAQRKRSFKKDELTLWGNWKISDSIMKKTKNKPFPNKASKQRGIKKIRFSEFFFCKGYNT